MTIYGADSRNANPRARVLHQRPRYIPRPRELLLLDGHSAAEETVNSVSLDTSAGSRPIAVLVAELDR